MKIKFLPIALCIMLFGSIVVSAGSITTVLFDVTAIFDTDNMRASSYVGKIDSLRYLSKVGHLPNQEDLFKQLKPIKAISTTTTYNNNLEMPLILSDWLSKAQSASKIKEIVQKHLSNKNLSDIEIKVLIAIVSMMLTASNLADTQKIRSHIESIVQKLRQSGYKLYLVGNWAQISAMRSEFPDIFKLFHGSCTSGELQLLKPEKAYYSTVLKNLNIQSANAVWIETESKFISFAKQFGYNVVGYKADDHKGLISGLRQFGINV